MKMNQEGGSGASGAGSSAASDPRADERPIVKLGDVVIFDDGGVDCAARVFHVTNAETGRVHLHVDRHDGTTSAEIDVMPGTTSGTWRARS